MVGIHNYEQRYRRILERIDETKDISNSNKKWIFGFRDYLLSEGIGLAKIERYMGDMFRFNRMLKKEFEEANKDDIRRVVSALNQEPLSEYTKRSFKIMMRKLYCYIRGIDERGVYPDEVRWMKMEIHGSHRKLPEDLLTEDEVRNMVQKCVCIRDKAFVSLLAESGCRISEIGMMKIRNVSFETYGARISVSGKTGSRKILIINSAPYLQEWINSHPNNDNPDAYLWCKTNGNLLTYSRLRYIIKGSAEKVGLLKRIHPHLLRHTRATQLASLMSDSQLKHYLGWTQSSKMAGIYVHMSGKDMDDAVLLANNIVVEKVKKESALKPLLCAKCKNSNPRTNKFCNICGFVLNEETANEILVQESKQSNVNNFMEILMKDPEVIEIMMRKIKEVKVI